jgi:beta-galactosidase
LRLTLDRPDIGGDGADAQPVTIEALDAKGRPVPTADLDIVLTIENGRIIGLGNGNPTSLAPSKGNRVKLFNGRAQVIIQSERDSTGQLILKASAEGVSPATVSVVILQGQQTPQSLPPVARISLQDWRQSPVTVGRPENVSGMADNDMNTWETVLAGQRPPASSASGYLVLFTRLSLNDAMKRQGAVLKFFEIMGRCEIVINGATVARKDVASPGSLSVPVAAGKDEVSVSVVMHVSEGEGAGLSGPVFLDVARDN